MKMRAFVSKIRVFLKQLNENAGLCSKNHVILHLWRNKPVYFSKKSTCILLYISVYLYQIKGEHPKRKEGKSNEDKHKGNPGRNQTVGCDQRH